jgi:GNAT superfamily N-acetyltransferase
MNPSSVVHQVQSEPASAEERWILRDGRRARAREIRPSDAPLLVQGFEQLSERSRRLRFFTPKRALSPREVAYLTQLDGQRHFAIGAGVLTDQGWQPAAVARFVGLPHEPKEAEPALTVVDAFQGLGLGRLLFARLVDAAVERGYRILRADVLEENHAMLRIFRTASAETAVRRVGGVFEVEIPLTGRRDSGWYPAWPRARHWSLG